MALSNTTATYGAVTKTFHWATALLIFTLIPLGLYANSLPYETSEQLAHKAFVFSLHKTLGISTFIVAVARIIWAISQTKPAHLHPERKLETFAAETVHWLLYGSLILVPLSGWIHHASTTGFAPIWWPFGQDLPLVPKSESVAAFTAGLHKVFSMVLGLSILLHVAGALKHKVIDNDVTLARMLPGTPELPDTPAEVHHSSTPLVAAVVAWMSALVIGAGAGVYAKHDAGVQAAALEAVQSDWVVEDGSLEITVTQLGSPVTGAFADWTAAIRFDETIESGNAGSVEVVVSIGSLTLGSVTAQAMEADFFDAQTFPIATFVADIQRGAEGYAAIGTLTIKDQTMPFTLPFTLDVAEGGARMTSDTTLDRRSYNVGVTSQPDETNVGFDVDIQVELTARNER